MELYYGAHKSAKAASNLAKVKRLEAEFEILPTGKESAEIFWDVKGHIGKSQGTGSMTSI